MALFKTKEEKRVFEISTQFKFWRNLPEALEMAIWLEGNMPPEEYKISGYLDKDGVELTVTFTTQEMAAKFRLFFG